MSSMLFVQNSTAWTLDFDTRMDWEYRSIIKRAIMEDEEKDIEN